MQISFIVRLIVKKVIIILTLFVSFISVEAQDVVSENTGLLEKIPSCYDYGTTIVYGNGMFNSVSDAVYSTKKLRETFISNKLHERIETHTKDIRYALAYNQDETAYRQYLEVVGAGLRQNLKGLGVGIRRFLNARRDDYNSYFRDDRNLSGRDTDGLIHLNYYRRELAGNRKIVLVSHSQGNFYANQIYSLLNSSERKSFANIQVATPTNVVSSGGPHYTLREDKVMSGLDTQFVNPILPANVSHTKTPKCKSTSPQIPCDEQTIDLSHSFTNFYLWHVGELISAAVFIEHQAIKYPDVNQYGDPELGSTGEPLEIILRWTDPQADFTLRAQHSLFDATLLPIIGSINPDPLYFKFTSINADLIEGYQSLRYVLSCDDVRSTKNRVINLVPYLRSYNGITPAEIGKRVDFELLVFAGGRLREVITSARECAWSGIGFGNASISTSLFVFFQENSSLQKYVYDKQLGQAAFDTRDGCPQF